MDISSRSRLDSEYCELDKSRALLWRLIYKSQEKPEALPNSEFISELIDDLLQNLLLHFEREERHLASISDPSLEKQRFAHIDLVEELSEICFDLLRGDKQTTHKLHTFLINNLQKHLLVETGNHQANC